MNNLTIINFSPRKERVVEIQPKDIEKAIDLITEIITRKINEKEETNVDGQQTFPRK